MPSGLEHISPETAALIAKAQAHGISVDLLLRDALRQEEEQEDAAEPPRTYEEWNAILEELLNSPSFAKAPPLPDDAFSRESLSVREDDVL